MDIRQPIHDSPEPVVLSVAFNYECTRFVCGMENGIRVFRSQDCIRTVKKAPVDGHSIAVAETLDDRYMAVVGGSKYSTSSSSLLEFWDNMRGEKLLDLDMSEPILGMRLTPSYFVVILEDRVVCLDYSQSTKDGSAQPGVVRGIYDTARNPYALCCISGDTMILPGLTSGQVQLLGLTDKRKRVMPAHDAPLRQIALSRDGEILATAGEKGTLIRVFNTRTQTLIHEFRRGVEAAVIFGLAISPSNQFIASTSDKGTLHIFDLRSPPTEGSRPPPSRIRRISNPRTAVQRVRPGSAEIDNVSIPSSSSSPMTAAGFYGPPPDISHTPPSSGPSVFSALSRVPGMPRAFSDVRSMTSIPYSMGIDAPNWQGREPYVHITTPNGQKRRIKNPVLELPGRPDGKPPKGVLAWDPDAGDRRLWVIAGGTDANWEVFDLVEDEGAHKLRIVKTGFRKYLTRQFPESF